MSGPASPPTAAAATAITIESDRSNRRVYRALLGLILLAAVLLRWFYLDRGYHEQRFWDERFSIENILPIVETGRFTLKHDYYPSPVWSLPPGYLLRLVARWAEATNNTSLRITEGPYVTKTGFRLLRGLQMVYGVIGIAALYAVGRRMFDEQVGLLAALNLAFVPWHIHASSTLKPDALQTTCVLLAFLYCLRIIDLQRPRDAVIAGVAIALALSSKFTGGLIALTLVLGTVLSGWRDRRRVLLLALAGAVSAGTFVLLNPDWLGYPEILARHGADYARRANAAGMTRDQILGRLLTLLLDWNGHGRIVGVIALLAMTLLLGSLARRSVAPMSRVHRAMCLFYPVIHTLVYIRQTAYFKENNFLTVFPFTALAASWGMVATWRSLTTAWPRLQHAAAQSLAIAVVLWLTTNVGFRYVYNSYLPTTYDAVLDYLHENWHPISPRLVLTDWNEESPHYEARRDFGGGDSAMHGVGGLDRQNRRRLDLADALLFPRPGRFGGGPTAQFYRELLAETSPSQIHIFKPRMLQLRGPTAVLIDRGWQEAQPSSRLVVRRCTAEPCYEAVLPDWVQPGEYATIHVWISFAVLNQLDAIPVVQVGSQRPELVWTHRLGGGAMFVSDRFVIEADSPRIRFTVGPVDTTPDTLEVNLIRWRDAAGKTALAARDRPRPRLFWHNRTRGEVTAWHLNGTEPGEASALPAPVGPTWNFVGVGEVGCQNRDTLVWQDQQTGELQIVRLDPQQSPVNSIVFTPMLAERLVWVESVADLLGTGCPQLLTRNESGERLLVTRLEGTTLVSDRVIEEPIPAGFRLAAVGNLDGDGFIEVFWQQPDGGSVIGWRLNAGVVQGTFNVPAFASAAGNWLLAGAIKLDDAQTLVVRDRTAPRAAFWLLAGENVTKEVFLSPMTTNRDWQLVGVR